MTNSPEKRVSKLSLGVAAAAPALVVVLLLGLVATQLAQAQTFTVLYNFTGAPDGEFPNGALVRDAKGNLYGTTTDGGVDRSGTVFKLDTSGKETVLYSFAGGSSDGGRPYGDLLQDKAGNLYGTTSVGGASNYGTVFKVSKSGKETVLHSFAGGKDGATPYAGLIQDNAGNVYGTTSAGGASNYGTVFKVSKSGKETVLHSFAGGKDGATPYAGLIQDNAGNVYGTTSAGGASNYGTVFKVSKSGKETVLYSFAGGKDDGCTPYGTPAMDKTGNIYGTTVLCGSSQGIAWNQGVAWKLSKKGTETVLHNFDGGVMGGHPFAGLILDAEGNLYGDTSESIGFGTVYELNSRGTEFMLHSFSGSGDGAGPYGDLIRDAKGTLYGTTTDGGSGGYGTVWQITR